MKKLLFLTAAIILSLAITSCGSASSDPHKAAEQFANAFYAGDFDKCNKLTSSTHKDEFTPEKEMSSLEKTVLKAIRAEAKKMGYRIKVDKEASEVEDDRAKIWFIITAKGDSNFDERGYVNLLKEDGKWGVTRYNLDK